MDEETEETNELMGAVGQPGVTVVLTCKEGHLVVSVLLPNGAKQVETTIEFRKAGELLKRLCEAGTLALLQGGGEPPNGCEVCNRALINSIALANQLSALAVGEGPAAILTDKPPKHSHLARCANGEHGAARPPSR